MPLCQLVHSASGAAGEIDGVDSVTVLLDVDHLGNVGFVEAEPNHLAISEDVVLGVLVPDGSSVLETNDSTVSLSSDGVGCGFGCVGCFHLLCFIYYYSNALGAICK